MYQEMTIIGHVGRVNPIKYLGDNESAVVNFSVAVTEKIGGKEETTWVDVSAWDELAKIVERYISKGELVMIKGRVRVNIWRDKNNNPRAGLRLNAATLRMLGGRPKGEETPV